jgi:hypothetical protein
VQTDALLAAVRALYGARAASSALLDMTHTLDVHTYPNLSWKRGRGEEKKEKL